jgi:hypothetical protein
MRKIAAVIASCLLIAGSNAMADPSAADQKWLEAVQKMVEKGQTKVSTPSQERVDLLKKWAAERGFSVDVAKTDAGYRIELTKSVARN